MMSDWAPPAPRSNEPFAEYAARVKAVAQPLLDDWHTRFIRKDDEQIYRSAIAALDAYAVEREAVA